jgi:hypothetical protein
MGACAAVGGSADAEDEHGEGCNGHDDLDVLAVDLAGENGEAGKFFVHGKHPFRLFVIDKLYNYASFKTGFKCF